MKYHNYYDNIFLHYLLLLDVIIIVDKETKFFLVLDLFEHNKKFKL